MHGLVNRAIQSFVCDTYGPVIWAETTTIANLDFIEFEAMLTYDDALTYEVLDALETLLNSSRENILEDIGTYLVSHPTTESLRRLLRFGGVDYIEFLHSLDDLPERARLAVPELALPQLELHDHAANRFSLSINSGPPGFGYVMMGILRSLADDYGALVFLNHTGQCRDSEIIEITLIESSFSTGRSFELGAKVG